MTKKPSESAHSAKPQCSLIDELRNRAEKDPRMISDNNMEVACCEKAAQLIHELRVHQLELEMQNEELRKTQEILQRTRVQYFELYQLAPVGYLTLNEKGLILEANLTASALLGMKKSALDKRPLSQFVIPKYQDAYYLFFRRLLADGNKHTCEMCMLRPNGDKFWVVLEANVTNSVDSGMRQVRCTLSDFTKRHQAEQQQRKLRDKNEQLLKLQVANQTIAAIAHDLNQPLSAAASYVDAAQNLLRKENNVPAKALHAIDEARQQIQRAGRVIHDLLALLHYGNTVNEAVDLNQLVSNVIEQLKKDTSVHEFQVVLKLTHGLPKVSANILQLEMILANLLRNAIEAMEDDGQTSGTIQITVCTGDNNTCAHLSVQDTGPGIPGEKLQSIFEAFFSTKPRGLGMGLAISRALIEAQGGQLWCESNTSSPGAIFHLTIPFFVSEKS